MAKAKRASKAVKKNVLASLWGLIAWLTGVLVSLAVGFGMISGTLIIPRIPDVVTAVAGWVVVILAILGALLKIIDELGN